MGLLETIAEKVEEEVTERGVEKALDSAESVAEERLYGGELEAAKQGISLLRGNSAAIAGLSKGAALSVLASISAGDRTKALQYSQVSLLSFHQRRELMQKGTANAIEAANKARASQEAIFKILEEGGRLLVGKALPFILAAL